MTFLAPGFLAATLGFALAAVALHLIAWRRPDDLVLPTARFVPDQVSRRAARAVRPADLVLLLLRLAMLAAIGLALARPVLTPRRAGVARVVGLDRSRAVARFAEARDSALAMAGGAAAAEFVLFDSAAAPASPEAIRSQGDSGVRAAGSLSAALALMLRRAEALRARHERVQLAIVSPFAREELDAATLEVRGLWPDSIRLIRVAPAARPPAVAPMEVRAADGDPVEAGLRLAVAQGMVDRSREIRVVRGALTAADSMWAGVEAGAGSRVLVHWPDSSGSSTGAPDERVRGVQVGDRALVGPLRAMALADQGAIVGRWLDGAPAVRQVAVGAGCTRTIGFDVPRDGDLALTVAFRRVAAALVAPCDGAADPGPLADSVLARLAAAPGEPAAPRRVAVVTRADGWLGVALLILALVLGLIESFVRQSSRRGRGSVGPGAPAGEAA